MQGLACDIVTNQLRSFQPDDGRHAVEAFEGSQRAGLAAHQGSGEPSHPGTRDGGVANDVPAAGRIANADFAEQVLFEQLGIGHCGRIQQRQALDLLNGRQIGWAVAGYRA